MRRWIVGILASCVGIGVACGGSTESVPGSDGGADGGIDPVTDAAIDRAIPDGGTPLECPAPLPAPTCASTAAPKGRAEVSAFLSSIASPIRCESGKKVAWDLRPLVALYGDARIFMIGEVHGSNEIGIVSSLVFEELARKDLVDVVAFEMPMDYEAPIQRWVDTGTDPEGEQVVASLAPNMFGSILPTAARERVAAGKPIEVGAVDIPIDPSFSADVVRSIAQKLVTTKATVLAALPASFDMPPSAEEKARTTTFFESVMRDERAICAELSAADCDTLVAMAHATWASAYAYDDTVGQTEEWFMRREVAIYYNMRKHLPTADRRMFLHMGAFHTNKHAASAGSRMAKEYPLTKGRVVSVAPAYGDGSIIRYGADQRLPGEPESVTSALGNLPKEPAFVSTTRPSDGCAENPLGLEDDDAVLGQGKRRDLYDGYIHYGKLTSEARPDDATLDRDLPVVGRTAKDRAGAALAAFRARIDRAEALASTRRLSAARASRR